MGQTDATLLGVNLRYGGRRERQAVPLASQKGSPSVGGGETARAHACSIAADLTAVYHFANVSESKYGVALLELLTFI